MASPFSLFRKHQKVFLAVAAVLAMVVFVFADMFTSMMSSDQNGREDTVVTSWSGGEITVGEIRNLQQRRYFISEVLQNIYAGGRSRVEAEGGTNIEPSVTPFFINRDAKPETVAEQVVFDRVLADLAKDSGMVVSDEIINHYLGEIGLGRVEDGEISQVLQRVGRYKNPATSEQVLFEGLRELLLGNNYMQSLSTSLEGADPSLIWNEWLTLNNRIKLQAAILPAEDFLSQVEEPSEVQLVDFYESHKNQFDGGVVRRGGKEFPAPTAGFRQPRKVKLKFLLGDVTAWTEKMLDKVTDEEIADYYERNKRTQFVKFDSVFDDDNSGMLDEIFENASEDDADSTEENSNSEEAESDSEESDDADAKPAGEDSGNVSQPSPFRLAAFQDDLEESGNETDVESNDTDDSEESEQADTVAEEDGADEDDDESRYEPLDKVRDQIRRQLATDKAVEEMSRAMDSAYSTLTSVYNRYGVKVVAAEADKTDPPEVPEELADLSGLAEEKGLFLEETVPLTASELSKTAVGKAIDSQTATMPVVQMAFQTLKPYQPALAVDIDGYRYLVLKVEDIAPQTPPFEEAREEVAEAWKMAEAKRLALEKGQEIAKKAEEEGSSLMAAVDQEKYEVVVTDFFSRFSFGSTAAEMRRGPRLSEVPPLEHIGDEFLKRVFTLEDNEVVALPNFDGSDVYVVRVDQKERTEDELHQAFLAEVNSSQAMQIMQAFRSQRMQRALIGQIFQRAGLDGQRLQQFLRGTGE